MLWTNRGKKLLFDYVFQGVTLPTHFYVALVTSAVAPTADTNTLSQLTEIANGNGYTTGGYELHPDTTDFDYILEDDALDKAILQIKNLIWTATGGPIPVSGNPARYAVLLDNNVTVGSRQVICAWDLGGSVSVTEGLPIALADCQLEAA